MARVFKNDRCAVIMEKKIKVVWICHFSNPEVRSKLRYGFYPLDVLRKIMGKSSTANLDFAQWNTNGVKEFEKFDDVDLSIIMPIPGIKGRLQNFDMNGIHYYCFRSEDDNIRSIIFQRRKQTKYTRNRTLIKNIIEKVSPDIIHVIGVENPYYSLATLDVPDNIPVLVYLQTLMSTPGFYENYTINLNSYNYRSRIEQDVIRRADYVCTGVKEFQNTILQSIKPDCRFLEISIAVGQPVDLSEKKKEYDFVYFASNVQKAADYAIEAFAIVCTKYPNLKLNIVGGFDNNYKSQLDNRLAELGISDNVFFSGKLPTHGDVMIQIKKSRFALLPMKVDIVASTIRESMASGLPIVTTITPGTPLLNKDRECLLLSEIGDFESMANNMERLLSSEKLCEDLKKNAALTFQEMYSNEKSMKEWRDAYKEIVANWPKRGM